MGVNECSGRPIFVFFIKENWIYGTTRHHAEPNTNILLTISELLSLVIMATY